MSKKENHLRIKITIAVLLIVVLWLLIPLVIHYVFGDTEHAGQFGDIFGSINALFSGLAMCGVIYAVILQSDELRLQREELKLQRDELKQTREEFRSQTAIFSQQTFEGTFFQMLRLYNEIVDAFKHEQRNGRIVISTWYNNLKAIYRSRRPELKDIYPIFRDETQNRGFDLNGYFRTIYNILKYIDNSSIEEKKRYSNLLRSQLSSAELAFLYYNCECFLGEEKMKPLVKKYAILKHLPEDFLFHKKN